MDATGVPHLLRPATPPGEDRNRMWDRPVPEPESCARPPRRARIATSPSAASWPRTGAAPGHPAGRGSQLRAGGRAASMYALRPATPPGEDRNPVGRLVQRSVNGCARPPRRARIATAPPPRPGHLVAGLRPATPPGEDRNTDTTSRSAMPSSCARPPRRARIATWGCAGSPARRRWRCARPPRRARIATPGRLPDKYHARAAPGHPAGRGSQP